MTEKKEKILEIEFDELIPEVVKALNKKEDAWVYKKLIKLFIDDFNNLEEYDEVFEMIALNPNTPLEILNILRRYEDEDVREGVVLNPSTPMKILREMSKDPSPYVRMALLKRDKVEMEFIELLADDNGEDREEEVGLFDHEIDEYLSNYEDEDELIDKLQVVIGNLEESEAEFYSDDDDFDDYDNDYDYDDLDNIDEEALFEMKLLIAQNPKTPAKILKKISSCEDEDVRIAVAKHKKTSFAVLEKLSKDEEEEVRAAILSTEKKNIKIKLYIDGHSEWINR